MQRSEDGGDSSKTDLILNQQKQFLIQCCVYLIDSKVIITLPGSNIFFQQLVSYINRVIITQQAKFINDSFFGQLG